VPNKYQALSEVIDWPLFEGRGPRVLGALLGDFRLVKFVEPAEGDLLPTDVRSALKTEIPRRRKVKRLLYDFPFVKFQAWLAGCGDAEPRSLTEPGTPLLSVLFFSASTVSSLPADAFLYDRHGSST
jgi:hypothetical protein